LEIIHIHLVDVYSIAKHPTSSTTRIEMWQDSAAVHPPSLPASTDELLVLLARRAERTLTVRGIELGGMFYCSDELMALRSEFAANNLNADRLSIRYNPWDLGRVWVVNPLDGTFLEAPAVDPAMNGMTEYQWRVLKRAVRERFDRPGHLMNLAAGRNAIRDVVEKTLEKPSRRRRSRAMRYIEGGSSAKDEPTEVPADDAATELDSGQDGHPESEQRFDEPSSPASPNVPIDPDDIDVSDWEVSTPDV
jgi:putative transposase